MTDAHFPRRWWLTPLIFSVCLLIVLGIIWQSSEIAREVLAKAVMMIVGALATPFILEASVALTGLVIVIAINQWRMQKEGDGWVYLAQTEPDAASVAEGAQTPPQRLDAVVMPGKPDHETDLTARLAMVEGFLDLGLKQEALAHLQQLSADEQQDARAKTLRQRASTED